MKTKKTGILFAAVAVADLFSFKAKGYRYSGMATTFGTFLVFEKK